MIEVNVSKGNVSQCSYDTNRYIVAFCSTFSVVMALMAIVGNSLVLLAIVKTPRLRFVTCYFIASLAVGDLYMNTVLIPLWVVKNVQNIWTMDNHPLAIAFEFLSIQMATSVAYNMCVVSIDRLISIRFVYEYPYIVTPRRCCVTIVNVWILSFLSSFPRLVLHDIKDISYLFVSLALFIIIVPYVAITYCYMRIYKIATSHANKIAINPFTRVQTERSKKAAVTIGLVIGIYTLLGLPVVVVAVVDSIMTSSDPCKAMQMRDYWILGLALSYSHSVYNPWIYAVRNQLFNRSIRKLLGLRPGPPRLFPKNSVSPNSST